MRFVLLLSFLGAVLLGCHEGRVPVDGVSRTIGFPGARAGGLSSRSDGLGWRVWGQEAFRVARKEDRPILVVVEAGWCQLCVSMARSVAEHPDVIGLIDSAFVPVILDRDHFPAVDARLQRALRVLTGLTGWPAVLALTPGGDPFFGSTYLPASDPLTGRGIFEALQQASSYYQEARKKVIQHGALVREIAWGTALQPGSIRPELVDSIALWATMDPSPNPAIAAFLYELAEGRSDEAYVVSAEKALVACEKSRELGRTPAPGLLEALATGYRVTGKPELAARLRRLASKSVRTMTESWSQSYTDHVGYTLSGLFAAADALGDEAMLADAVTLLDDLWAAVGRNDGLISHYVGTPDVRTGLMDDYAGLAAATSAAYSATGASRYLERVADLLDRTANRFAVQHGGPLSDADGDPSLAMLVESPLFIVDDGIMPSANATIARVSTDMYRWTGNDQWLVEAAQILESFAGYPTELTRAATYGRAVHTFLQTKSERVTRQ